MNWISWTLLVCIQLYSPCFILLSGACWGRTATNYGETSKDYDLLVGSELDLNCTLKSEILNPGKVDSSHLLFKKDNKILTKYTHVVDSRTAQLILPNAQVNDSGFYHCVLNTPDKAAYPHVCSTIVSVGYVPQNVTNFQCISRNFDNLTCTWDIEPNKVKTNYSLQKNLFSLGAFQNCPTKSSNNTFCQWRNNTDPPYQTSARNITFIVHGNNSLGTFESEFVLDHYKIVIPNSPENFSALKIQKYNITLKWKPPQMKYIEDPPDLYYQLWLEEIGSKPQGRIVIDVGRQTLNYTIDKLIPYYLYNITLRCRSDVVETENLWSPIISIQVKTLPDVPTVLPEVNPLGFELYNFIDFRNATLYLKPVSHRNHYGKDFYYHVIYHSIKSDENSALFVKSQSPVVKIGHLRNDSAYVFEIHSANKEGISEKFKKIYIAERNKILSSPQDIRAISNEHGYYNLSWTMEGNSGDYFFRVFWCSILKPSKSSCDGPIQWSKNDLEEGNFILNVSDTRINFQFAVAAFKVGKDNSVLESSGIEWASCVVSQKAPLGKIPIRYIEQKDSSTLKIIWSIDCEAQKSVIDRYEIKYCRLGKKKECKTAKVDSDEESYVLHNLHPFSNYSIKLRAFNKENVPSEDMAESFESTLPGVPSDSPQKVHLQDRIGNSLLLSWLPPTEPNGIISHYNIYYNEARKLVWADPTKEVYSYNIEGLSYFTLYNISVDACVGLHCSNASEPLMVVTEVGEPGMMDPPRVEMINSTSLKISWGRPVAPNGPIDLYLVQWQREDDNVTYSRKTSNLSTIIDFDCSTTLSSEVSYLFYVQAANLQKSKILYGPSSNSIQGTPCIMPQSKVMLIGVVIGGAIGSAVFLIILYRLLKWMHDKIHQVKNIAVRLPKELEGPELNPLSNYESFKNGLTKPIQNGKVEQLSYVFEEKEIKNRHGSGSSQFSNSSADELVFKNGKCTKFGRKPSGDSSGCSSMSSNTTTRVHLSSDSGGESDCPAPSSPDSGLANHNMLKVPLPILNEQETLDLSSATQPYTNKYYNFVTPKTEHPYSKFGVTGVASSVPRRANSLAFYSCNLANSEPSVFDSINSERETQLVTPYSKVGMAKSSGDILHTVSPVKGKGYSKFGHGIPQDCFVIDASNLNPTVGMAMVQNTPNGLWSKGNGSCNSKNNNKNLKTETKQIAPPKCSTGYVSIGDLRCQKDSSTHHKSFSADNDDLYDLSSMEIPSMDITLSHIMSDICVGENKRKFDAPASSDQYLIDLSHSSSLPSSSVTPKANGTNCTPNINSFPSNIYNSGRNSGVVPRTDINHSYPQNQYSRISISPITETNCNSIKPTKPSEILLTPIVSKNGYVPFSNLTSSTDQTVSVPKPKEPNIVPQSVFPSDTCTEFDQNYITPSNKGDLRLLQENLVSKNNLVAKVVPVKGKDSLSGGKIYTLNGNNISKLSGPLKHLLKPLPKMESEICEV